MLFLEVAKIVFYVNFGINVSVLMFLSYIWNNFYMYISDKILTLLSHKYDK